MDDMEEVSEPESEPCNEFESGPARYNWDVSSHMEERGGKRGIEGIFLIKGGLRKWDECSSSSRVCMKCGIVEISGERAQGFVDDVRSCSKVGSTRLQEMTSLSKMMTELTA